MIGLKDMKFEKENEILGAVASSLIERKEGMCLTDEEFALYIEGRLSNDERKAMISHFVSCRDCRERLTIPIPHFEEAKEPNSIERLLSSLWRPLIVAPIAAVFIAFLTFTLFVYQKPQDITEERLRGANLVALKQLDITSNLLIIIKEGDEQEFKNEIIKELPPNLKVSRVIIEDIKNLKESKEGDKIVIILYNDGSLKVKRGE
ncbi:MAG: hypothetical protein HW396_426 [Candidatus Dadabacteria bacterium]|nr:hypothetical protein [Candidatus Dadabacteria bacterium]